MPAFFQILYLWAPMQKKLLIILCLPLLFWACSNEFEVNAEWEERGIVYGLLDLSKSSQFIRVNKAFLDTEEPIQSATDIAAGTVDSIYFSSNTTVSLDEYNENNDFKRTITLERVSSAEAGLGPKEEGVFNNSEYYAYKTDEAIKSKHSYEVKVITDSGNEMTSRTSLADEFGIGIPNQNLSNPAQTTSYEMAAFEFLKVAWTRAENAVVYDLTVRVNIQEFDSVNETETKNYYLDWVLLSNFRDEQTSSFSNIEHDFTFTSFLEFLASRLDPDPDVFRIIDHIDFVVAAGTSELEQFRAVSLAAGSSINNGQAKPFFSNIENGIGLFASVNTTVRRVLRFTTSTQRGIACDPIMEGLNFSPFFNNLSETCP